jgi:hypothetical protein
MRPMRVRRALGQREHPATFDKRSQTAQYISDDEVCTRVLVRSSHVPASA